MNSAIRWLLLVCLLTSIAAGAEPVPNEQRIPVDIRRTTFVVRDIEKSLALYRDALGLTVIYDQIIATGGDKEGKLPPSRVRLVLLRANDTYIGALGLMQRLDQPTPPPSKPARPTAGDTILVVNVGNLEERWPRIVATPYVTVDIGPKRIEYPAGGGGVIPVLFSAVWDADGNYIELNKILGPPAGTATNNKP